MERPSRQRQQERDTERESDEDALTCPECFEREYADCDTVDEALTKARQATPDDLDERDRCPNCRSTQLAKKRLNREMSHRVDKTFVEQQRTPGAFTAGRSTR